MRRIRKAGLAVLCCGYWLLLAASAQAADMEIHDHKSRDIGDYPEPQIAINIYRDPIDGVNLHIELERYRIESPSLPGDSQSLSGHAHLFINGVKKQRLYARDAHIPASWLKPGVNQIAVSLNSHQHENWTINGREIVASVFFNLEAVPPVLHAYSSSPVIRP